MVQPLHVKLSLLTEARPHAAWAQDLPSALKGHNAGSQGFLSHPTPLQGFNTSQQKLFLSHAIT